MGFVVEIFGESFPMIGVYCLSIVSAPQSFSIGSAMQWLSLLASLSTCALHGSQSIVENDMDRSCRSYYPEYWGCVDAGKLHILKLGVALSGFGSFGMKLLAVSALLTVNWWLCLVWLVAEFWLLIAARVTVTGEWRGYIPGTESIPMR